MQHGKWNHAPSPCKLAWIFSLLVLCTPVRAQEPQEAPPAKTVTSDDGGWIPLLTPGSLEGWKRTNFGGEGEVRCDEEGVLHLAMGEPLTGITYEKEFPRDHFEVRFKARRTQGSDFLVGLTFPVDDSYCSWIAGGWGGSLVGLSSINSSDASENESTQFFSFKNDQWYSFWIRVDSEYITATIDDKQYVKVPRKDRKFSIRSEVRESRPFGYAVYQSRVEVRDFEYRNIVP